MVLSYTFMRKHEDITYIVFPVYSIRDLLASKKVLLLRLSILKEIFLYVQKKCREGKLFAQCSLHSKLSYQFYDSKQFQSKLTVSFVSNINRFLALEMNEIRSRFYAFRWKHPFNFINSPFLLVCILHPLQFSLFLLILQLVTSYQHCRFDTNLNTPKPLPKNFVYFLRHGIFYTLNLCPCYLPCVSKL